MHVVGSRVRLEAGGDSLNDGTGTGPAASLKCDSSGKNAWQTYGVNAFVAVNESIFTNVVSELNAHGTANLGDSFTKVGSGTPPSTADNLQTFKGELLAAARRMGLRVELDVRETGKGSNNDRPGLVCVLEAAQHGAVDVVLVWKLDRFGRSAFDLLGNIRQLDAAGVRFVSVTQGIDIRPGGDPMSRLLITDVAVCSRSTLCGAWGRYQARCGRKSRS